MGLAFELLQNGSLFQAVDVMFQAVISHWWVVFLFIFTLVMVYVGTLNEGAVAAVGIVGSAFLVYHLPDSVPVSIHGVYYFILVFSLAMLFYKLFGKGD